MFLSLDKHPAEAISLRDELGQCVTYGTLCAAIDTLSDVLTRRCVALCLCRNTVGSIIGYAAMLEHGVVPLLVSAAVERDIQEGLIEAYRPSFIWQPLDMACTAASGPRATLFDYALYETRLSPYPLHEELELCMLTSGSTGSPKVVRHKRGNLQGNAEAVAKAFGWTPAETTLADLSMNYTMGLNVINAHLAAGATVVLSISNIVSKEHWQLYDSMQITNITGVPFMFDTLRRLGFFERDLPRLGTIAQGGGRLTPEMFDFLALHANESGRRFIATYGATETSARMTMLPHELALEKTCSIGRPLPGASMSLVDESGCEITSANTEGELVFQGPGVALGYAQCWQDLALGDVWQGVYRTGDLAVADSDGCYYIRGRKSRFLKLLGYRIDLDACEVLLAQELHVQAACTGSDSGMRVYVEHPADPHACLDLLVSRLGLRPSLVKCIPTELLPRGSSGKIQYGLL